MISKKISLDIYKFLSRGGIIVKNGVFGGILL